MSWWPRELLAFTQFRATFAILVAIFSELYLKNRAALGN